MPSYNTEGIILKRSNFGESDRVLTVLTERFGKIPIIARGVRKITSRRAGNVEVLNRVKVNLFKGRGYTLTEAESLETYQKIKENLTLSTYAFHILELIDKLLPEEQKNPQVYDLLTQTLNLLDNNPRQIFIRGYEVKLLSLLGFFSVDAISGLSDDNLALLGKLEYDSWEEIEKITLNKQQNMELEKILRYYIERILERSLKSVQVLKKIHE